MALTVFETAEQRLPCHVDHADGGGSKVVAAEQAVPLQETDHGGSDANDQPRPERDDVWNMIQSQTKPAAAAPAARQQGAYVRRSSSLLSQKSLEICTESLGSETGSDGFSDADGAGSERSGPESDDDAANEEVAARGATMPSRAFPPPLPSLARRTVASTLQMRQHRRDGRLVVEAVPVLSSTLFHAQRRGGRLLLCFADTASDEEKNRGKEPELEQQAEEQTHEEDVVEEEEEDEEVEVVDRGTVVEVKVVSTQPQAHSSGARVHRSSLVINKFVGAEPVNACEINDAAAPLTPPDTTTEAVAAAAASALSATQVEQLPEEGDDGNTSVGKPSEGKLLMTTRRRRSKQELLNHMRRCGQLSGQLFIWEPRVATSS